MKYYKDSNSKVWAYENNADESFINDSLISITEVEAKELEQKELDRLKALEEDAIANYVPQSLSRFQAVRVLKSFKVGDSNLYKLTDNYIKSLDTDVEENDEIVDAWELAQEFKRDSTTILAAQKQFDLTEEQVNQMFIDGAKITA